MLQLNIQSESVWDLEKNLRALNEGIGRCEVKKKSGDSNGQAHRTVLINSRNKWRSIVRQSRCAFRWYTLELAVSLYELPH